jgi:hypothetical protein
VFYLAHANFLYVHFFAYDECFQLLQQVQLLSAGSMDLVGPLLVAMASLLDTPGGLQFPLYRVVVSGGQAHAALVHEAD